MSENHTALVKTKTVNLHPFEAHIASACVAIIFGSMGGLIGLFSLRILTENVSIIITILFGFYLPWVVCKYLFKTAHQWYGQNSFAHRIYDAVGIFSAVVVFYMNL